jgi:DNA polymerase-3 subunit alpha
MDPSDIASRAAKLGMPAIAQTDTCNLYGAVPFYKYAKGKDVRPIIGAELHVQPEGVDHTDPEGEEGGYQIVALVEDEAGYKALCWLVTQAIYEGIQYKPRIDLEMLRERHEGLIFLTGGLKGAFGRPLQRGEDEQARAQVVSLLEILGPNALYLELQDHGLDGQVETNEFARELSQDLGIQTVATNAVHYAGPEDAVSHEVLNGIAMGTSMSDMRRLISPTDQAYLKSEAEMRELFPDDGDAIDRTVEIAERCNFHYTFDDYHFPATTPPDFNEEGEQPDTDANWEYFYRAFPPPASYGLPTPEEGIPPRPEGAGNMNGFFRWYTLRGLDKRLEHIDEALWPQYFERVEIEFGIVLDMGFPAYFLIVAEFINWSKDNGIPVGPGRGSAAGSLIAYAMGITDIDPIRFDLLFERFLNPERVSMPDVDVDFCQDRREEAIEHVRVKYGAPLVSQIITYGKLKAKAAVRDVARVLDLTFTEADRIAKLIPDALGTSISDALKESEQLVRLYEGDPKVRRVIDTALSVENLCRQTGVHAAGVIIADRPLVEYAPLYRDGPDGGPVVQYDMKSAEGIGLIKFDFLGLKTLDQIRDAVAMIEVNHGVALDMAHIPVDDEATYHLLQEGDALGVFQLESSGMRELLTRLRPSVLDDLVALVALYRPGPLSSGMVDDFVDRKHGRQEVSYPHDSLIPILKSTYGTIVYQEQVMQIAQVMSGYSLGEADLLRRAMGKKKAEEMAKQKTRFLAGAVDNDVNAKLAEEIFDLLAKFAAYGFNKSHSAAYGYVSYQTAYLKAHYRPEYMAALMSIEAANTDKVLTYIQDCRRSGIEVLPVCVNESIAPFSVPKESVERGETVIRFGMSAVKNVGGGSIRAILEARESGPFRDPLDFFERVDPRGLNKRVSENLIKAGAFDFSGVPRAALLAGLDDVMAEGARRRRDAEIGQFSMFSAPTDGRNFRFPALGEFPLSQKLGFERAVLGLYLSGHPMEAHDADVERFASARVGRLADCDIEGEIRMLGVPSDIKTVKTRRGDKMAFVNLEDAEGVVECVFFSDPWMRSQSALKAGGPVLVTGRLERDGDAIKVLASTAEPLVEARSRTVRQVRFEVSHEELSPKRITTLSEVVRAERGSCEAKLVVSKEGRFVATFSLPDTVAPSIDLEERVTTLFGRPDVVSLQ